LPFRFSERNKEEQEEEGFSPIVRG
jgi:hypothetical protein